METVTIKDLDNFARGITHINNKICFVDKALPTEECNIEIINEKKNYSEGKVLELLKESNYRIMPLCPYYDKCGGCSLLHLDRQSELIYKEEKVFDLIKKFSKIDNIPIKDIVYDNEYYYRNKITLHIKDNKLGLYEEKTNKLIEIDECLITDNGINKIILRLKEYLKTKNNINRIIIRKTSLNEKMISIYGECDISKLKEDFKDINSVYVDNKLILGNKYITEKIHDLEFYIYPESFFQVNYNIMIKMYDKVINYYKEHPNLNILDLYCGTGTMSMLVSKYVKSAVGIEINSDAITSANLCLKKNNIKNVEYILGSVEDNIDRFESIDSIIVDPPRSGLDKHSIASIININPSSIIYISCDPATLARDLEVLKEYYNILEITPFDMFPNTYHVESFVVLERKFIRKGE